MSYQVKHKPLVYYGGKSRLLDDIIPIIPPHDVYCEPFAGGASVFWAKPLAKKNILNDKDIRLYKFYKVASNRKDELISELEKTIYHAHEKAVAWEVCKNAEHEDDLRVAVSVFVCIMQGFGGKIDSCFGRDYDPDHSSVMERYYSAIDCLPSLLNKIKGCQSDNLDAIDFIDRINKKSKNVFMFVDPPYYQATQGHYNGYTEGDFLSLLNVLKDSSHRFILTCYDCEHIHKFGWNIYLVKTSNNINDKDGADKRKKIEAIVTNYKQAGQMAMF